MPPRHPHVHGDGGTSSDRLLDPIMYVKKTSLYHISNMHATHENYFKSLRKYKIKIKIEIELCSASMKNVYELRGKCSYVFLGNITQLT